MTVSPLKDIVYRANVALAESGLVFGTFGNVSAADHSAGIMVIKPSGVPYAELSPDAMVAVSLDTGAVTDSRLRPSSDAPTHLELYRAWRCSAIVHTHSESATTLAQARLPVRCMGTTHADYFRGDIPVTRPLTASEIAGDYERNTGLVIIEAFRNGRITPGAVPGVLVANHGPFAWGEDTFEAIERARVLEWLARMDITGRLIAPGAERPSPALIDRHYSRKHGDKAYYGQTR